MPSCRCRTANKCLWCRQYILQSPSPANDLYLTKNLSAHSVFHRQESRPSAHSASNDKGAPEAGPVYQTCAQLRESWQPARQALLWLPAHACLTAQAWWHLRPFAQFCSAMHAHHASPISGSRTPGWRRSRRWAGQARSCRRARALLSCRRSW